MSSQTHGLWPTLIRPKVLSPRVILRHQAIELAKMTGGLLEAEIVEKVVTDTSGFVDDRIVLSFEVFAPSLNYRHRILRVAYDKDLPYPAFVEASPLLHSGKVFSEFVETGVSRSIFARKSQADTEEAFTDLLSTVLGSGEVVSVIQSMIARATEVLGGDEGMSDRISPGPDESNGRQGDSVEPQSE